MKLVSHFVSGELRAGLLVDSSIYPLDEWIAAQPVPGFPVAGGGLLRLLQAGPGALRDLRLVAQSPQQLGASIPVSDAVLLAPVPRPGKIVIVGRNYREHADEIGGSAAARPRLLAKFPSSTRGHGAIIGRPSGVEKLDYEGELAVVIGSRATHVSIDVALGHVAGYTVLNDLTAREFQFDMAPPQTSFAKSMDGFAPMGPWLVTSDEVADPQSLFIRTWVNAELRQQASTASMLLGVADLISYISRFTVLEPGDVVATGTPAGCGAFAKPPRYLQPGDQVRIEITGVGVLENTIG